MLTEMMNRKILIVDDDPGVRQALRIMLEVDDFEVVGEAVNGIEAIPRAIDLEPGVIILDHQMPRRDGEQTAAIIRQLLPGVRIIAFSAVLDGQPSWADAWLNKTRIVDLTAIVEGLLEAQAS